MGNKQSDGGKKAKEASVPQLDPEKSNSNGKAPKPMILGKNCDYDEELRRLQIELVKLQEWIRHSGLRVVVLFEGRDAAGKGEAIKRITQSLIPVCVASWRSVRRRNARRRNGISRVMWHTFPRPVRSSSLIRIGTTAPVSNMSWATDAEIYGIPS